MRNFPAQYTKFWLTFVPLNHVDGTNILLSFEERQSNENYMAKKKNIPMIKLF